MSTIAFVLAPEREIPEETDAEWFGRCTAFTTGTWMAWREQQGALNPGPQRVWFDSPSLTSNAADYMAYNRAEHRPAFHDHVKACIAEWQKNGCPQDAVYGNGAREFAAYSGLPSGLGLRTLWGYRGMTPVPGSRTAYLKQEADLHEFDLTGEDVQMAVLDELHHAYGGHALGLWNFGHCLNLLHYGPTGRHHFRLRLNRPSGSATSLRALKEALKGSPLEPDWTHLEAPHWEMSQVFQAFGVKGALDLVPKEGSLLWTQFDQVASALLTGQVPDAATLKAFNATLKKYTSESPLPAKPGKGMARKVFNVAAGLRRVIGGKDERFQAAHQYWDFSEGRAAEDWTVGTDSKGLGVSASLGRLMTYYPQKLRRDPIFWALSASEAESANGHAFVAAMECLAENAQTVGMTLALIPAPQIKKFREKAGIEAIHNEPVEENGWCAEVFVDLPGLLKGKPIELLQKHKALILRMEADDSWQNHSDPLPNQPDPAPFARNLDPQGLLQAAGFAKLLAPISEQPKTERTAKTTPLHSKEATARATATLPAAQDGDWTRELPDYLKSPNDSRVVHLRIAVNTTDGDAVAALATDLARALKGQAWTQGSVILFSREGGLARDRLHGVLGDLPLGSQLGAVTGKGNFHLNVT